jgi:hypothetical protein
LEQEKGALTDVNQAAILRQSDLADQVWSLEKKLKQQQEKFSALAKPNPKFGTIVLSVVNLPLSAIEKLEKESDPLFVYGCKNLKDKQVLLKEALTTVNPDVIIFVVSYLHVLVVLTTVTNNGSSHSLPNCSTQLLWPRKKLAPIISITSKKHNLPYLSK